MADTGSGLETLLPVAAYITHSHFSRSVESLFISSCIANWLQWEGVGWSWVDEANRVLYERALVVFWPSFMTHSASSLPWALLGAGSRVY